MPKCEDCRYFDVVEGEYVTVLQDGVYHDESVGLCRISPPNDGWPKVVVTDWCGSHISRDGGYIGPTASESVPSTKPNIDEWTRVVREQIKKAYS